METEKLIDILRASIAPCVFISGIGLLLLTLTNRLARPIDRIRQLRVHMKNCSEGELQALQRQVIVLYKRSTWLKTAIAFLVVSLFCVSLVMLVLFLTLIYGLPIQFLIQFFFMGSLFALLFGLIYFFLDIHLTLHSIQIEIQENMKMEV